MLPDYAGGSLLNLMATIAQACGAGPRHAPLRDLPTGEVTAARNVVLLILDGLGDRLLRSHAAGESSRAGVGRR